MNSDRKAPSSRVPVSDHPPEELKKERDVFLKSFFRKGAKLTEELVRERDLMRHRFVELEEENVRLRTQLASDAAIRELLTKIEELERDKQEIIARYREVEQSKTAREETVLEVEGELANLANLYVASFQLHSSLSPHKVMRHVKELLGQLVGAEAFAIYLVDDSGAFLVPVTSEGLRDDELATLPAGDGPIGTTFTSGETHLASDDSRAGTLDRPAACIPLRLEKKVVGVIVVYRTLEQKDAFVNTDHELFKLLGAQAMSALIGARLYSQRELDESPLASFRDLGA